MTSSETATIPGHEAAVAATATTLDQSPDNNVTTLQRAAIGSVNTAYYLPLLGQFETRDRATPSWNWAASLFTLSWMVFRQLWRPAQWYSGVLLAAVGLLLVAVYLVMPLDAPLGWTMVAAIAAPLFLVPGVYGNSWLHGVYRRRIDRALALTTSLQAACVLLNRQASSRQRLVSVIATNGVLALVLLALWWSVPPSENWPIVRGDVETGKLAPAAGVPAEPVAPVATPAANADAPLAVAPAADTVAAPLPAGLEPGSSAAATLAGASAPAAATAPSAAATTTAPAAAPTPTPTPSAMAGGASGDKTYSRTAGAGSTGQVVESATGAGATATADGAAASKKARLVSGVYAINVGLFAQPDNARRVHARLKQADLPVFSEPLKTAKGTLTRVRVGPFKDKARADKAAARIRELQFDAVVFRQP